MLDRLFVIEEFASVRERVRSHVDDAHDLHLRDSRLPGMSEARIETEVVVVGAGLAGLSAARELTRRGV
ncbi:MAG: FAD-dependent monooxygenase, partial [Solirubrobacterales bacterium]|nr:FAD-dependent monooxygenase [Solirubrobacterales bacterium]